MENNESETQPLAGVDQQQNEASENDRDDHSELNRFEHMGARPKQSTQPLKDGSQQEIQEAAKPEKKSFNEGIYTIRYIENINSEQMTDGCMQVQDHALIFSGSRNVQIELTDLRWVGCQHKRGGLESFIILSYYGNGLVGNMFFTTETGNLFNKCFVHLQELVKSKFSNCLDSHGNINKAKDLVTNDLPLFIDEVDMTVSEIVTERNGDIMYRPNVQRNEFPKYLMLIDVECVTWYQSSYGEHAYQLMFWREEVSNTVELIKRNRNSNTLVFESKTLSFSVPAIQKIIINLKNLSPKKTNILRDASAVVELISSIDMSGKRDSGSANVELEPSPINQNWTTASQSGEYNNRALEIQNQLTTVLHEFQGNEDFEVFWVTIEQDLLDIISSGTIPTTDYFSGGLDMNSAEHLEKSLNDVEDQLKENNLAIALSREKACRELFNMSEVASIRAIFEESNDIELLQKLYFKSLRT